MKSPTLIYVCIYIVKSVSHKKLMNYILMTGVFLAAVASASQLSLSLALVTIYDLRNTILSDVRTHNSGRITSARYKKCRKALERCDQKVPSIVYILA